MEGVEQASTVMEATERGTSLAPVGNRCLADMLEEAGATLTARDEEGTAEALEPPPPPRELGEVTVEGEVVRARRRNRRLATSIEEAPAALTHPTWKPWSACIMAGETVL
jgi:hypothetical protein